MKTRRPKTLHPRPLAALLITALLAACGGVAGVPAGPAGQVLVSIAGGAVTLTTGQSHGFAAAVAGTTDTAVAWSTSGGLIGQDGLYVAPSIPGSYSVYATAHADGAAFDAVQVTVQAGQVAPAVTIAVTPPAATIAAGATVQLSAVVGGSSNGAVTWSVLGAGAGAVSAGGLYTAPATAGVYTVEAVPAADPTKQATASITVTATSGGGGGTTGGGVGTSGSIAYHIAFPSTVGGTYQLAPAQVDLLMSEFIAGAMLGHLIHEHRPAMQLDRDHLYGALFAQWLQENLQPDYLDPTQDWIDTEASQRTMLLTSGQGGPFQLNDYSKRLESNLGMVNFVMLQQGLGYSVADQDGNVQTGRTGPATLEDKYFGPMVAAYFHYNDLLRVETLAASSWYVNAADTTACLAAVEAGRFPYFDMVLDAIYNAGDYSGAYAGYAALCAHAGDPAWAVKLSHIEDDTLSDAAYVAATGINDAGTFILYPRQIRNYLDQLYGIDTHVVPATQKSLRFDLPTLRAVYVRVFQKLGISSGASWRNVTAAEAGAAFDAAVAKGGLSSGAVLDVAVTADRARLFDLLDAALAGLQASLGVKFSATAEVNLAIGEQGASTGGGGAISCPASPPVYPSGLGSYTSGTVVKAGDGKLYQCLAGVSAWCNSSSATYYAPGTGFAWASAWALLACP